MDGTELRKYPPWHKSCLTDITELELDLAVSLKKISWHSVILFIHGVLTGKEEVTQDQAIRAQETRVKFLQSFYSS